MLRRYFQDYFGNLPGAQAEKEKLQLGDFMKLLKNSGMDSEYGQIMGRSLHGLYDRNKVDAFKQGLNFATTKDEAGKFTIGVISNIGESGANAEVQSDLIDETSRAAEEGGFQSQYVSAFVPAFGQVNPQNAKKAADMTYRVDARTANTEYEKLLDNSESTEVAVKGNTQVTNAVKLKYGDDFEIVSVSDDTINACSKRICHMIDAGEIEGASALFEKNKKYLKDVHKLGIANAASDYAVGTSGDVDDRRNAAALTVNATVKIEDEAVQLDTATATTKKMAEADEEIKEAYLTSNAENLHEYKAGNQLKVDEMSREIDTEEQVYAVTAADYGHLLAVENQKEFVQRTMDSGNEEAANNIAEHSYDYDISNRDDIIKMLKEQGYESTMKTLEEARAKYEAQIVDKPDKKSEDTATTETVQNNLPEANVVKSSQVVSAAKSSEEKINNLVSGDLSTNQMVKQLKNFTPAEQNKAINTIMKNANTNEIKGLILSGLKTEVMNYLFSNFTAENRTTLESVDYLMTPKEKAQYQELIQAQEKNKTNFFIQ